MPFILFLVLILLIVNGVAVFRFVYRLALFFIIFTVVGLASYFLVSSLGHHDRLSELEASPEVVIQENFLKTEIRELRIEIKSRKNLREKQVLTRHLEQLEKLQAERSNQEEAIRALEDDKRKLNELRELEQRLEDNKKRFAADAKRLEELNYQIRRSQKIIEKMNDLNNNNVTKGNTHD
jgi:DNA repair exonuclease SbcCD ATPase subunit